MTEVMNGEETEEEHWVWVWGTGGGSVGGFIWLLLLPIHREIFLCNKIAQTGVTKVSIYSITLHVPISEAGTVYYCLM